jgi:hypothetical protein
MASRSESLCQRVRLTSLMQSMCGLVSSVVRIKDHDEKDNT